MTPKRKHSGYERSGLDFYVEPRWVTERLADTLKLPKTEGIWDPACGSGTIPEVFRDRGLYVVASDISDRGYVRAIADSHNFFRVDYLCIECRHIVTNPPYRHALAFAERAIELTHKWYGGTASIFTRLDWLAGQRRYKLFVENPPALVLIMSKRPSCPPGGLDVPAFGGMHDFCWVIWQQAWRHGDRDGHSQPTQIRWVL